MYAEMNKQFAPLAPVGSTEGPQGAAVWGLLSASHWEHAIPSVPCTEAQGSAPAWLSFPACPAPLKHCGQQAGAPAPPCPWPQGTPIHPSPGGHPLQPSLTWLPVGTVWLITCHISPRLVPRKGCVADGLGSQIFSKPGGGRPAAPKGAPRPLARQGGLTCPSGVPRQGDARGGRRGDDDVGNIQVLVAQDGGLVVAAAADTHF